MLDRFALYELCVQSPDRDARVLTAIHGHAPHALGEDFCGTAGLSRSWAELGPKNLAVAVDHDAPTLARAHRHARVELIQADVHKVRSRVDVIAVQNFSICELHTRAALVRYLKHARSRLNRRGCFVCDIYDGADAFFTGPTRQRFKGPGGETIDYFWEQRTANPFNGRVTNAMHFHVRGKKRKPTILDNAFVYEWRLWSVRELRDAMTDAGFSQTQVYPRMPDAMDGDGEFYIEPLEDPAVVGDSFNVYVVGRAE